MIEIDANAISTGVAFQQLTIPASMNGNFALSVSGQGFFHSAPASYQPDTTGQVTLNGTGLGVGIGGGGGNLDINTFNSTFASDIISPATSTLSTPGSYNRPWNHAAQRHQSECDVQPRLLSDQRKQSIALRSG